MRGGRSSKSKRKGGKPAQANKSRHWLAWKPVAIVSAVLVAALLAWIFRPVTIDLPSPPLKALAAERNVELGMLAQPGQLTQQPFQQVLTSQYSMIASDGQIHWDKFRPTPTTFDFGPMDREVAFAQAHNMTIQAHHLVWDEEDSLPKWLKKGDYSKQQLLDILHNHITTTVSRYKGRVQEWSVVNEAFTRQQHIFNQTGWWSEHIGSMEYVDDAFRWAHEADPNAKLILNDYFNEMPSSVTDALYNYLKGAKARGVPIDGVGIQMHVDSSYPRSKAEMTKTMQRYGSLGYKVYITEFDMRAHTALPDPATQAQLEARLTSDVVEACVAAGNCTSLVVFGMRDMNNFVAWVTRARAGERSFLLDARWRPKPSFDAFRAAWTE